MKEIVFIILDNFPEYEAAFLSWALNDKMITENYMVKYASTDKNIKTSVGGLKVLPDIAIDDINDNIAAIILIGAEGSWRTIDKITSEKIVSLVKHLKENDKVVGAICDAARYLAENGLLNDCRHTVNDFEEIKDMPNYTNYKNYIETDINSIIDGKTVTASGVAPLHFAANIMRSLGDIPENNINLFYDLFTIGFKKAMEKYTGNNK